MTSSDELALGTADPEAAEGEEESEQVAVIPEVDWVDLPGSESLDVEDADVIAADVGATVILVAGKNSAGKTSLLVQLYAQFLNGAFAGLEFAGSETLDAYDERHFGLRVDSGNDEEEMDHTEDVDMRFLHLRLADESGRQRSLLPTDLVGELFTDIRDGARVQDRVPIARRADKTLLLIDGEEIRDLATRQIAERDARLVLAGLTESGGLRPETPVMIVLTKADLLDDDHLSWFTAAAERLIEFATEQRGLHTVVAHVTAALPRSGDVRGLTEVIEWMWELTATVPPLLSPPAPNSDRVFVTAAVLAR